MYRLGNETLRAAACPTHCHLCNSSKYRRLPHKP